MPTRGRAKRSGRYKQAGMITSTSNPRVQAARRLRRRSGRDEARAYLVEGGRAVAAALAAGVALRDLFVDPASDAAVEVERAATAAGTPVTEVSANVVNALSDSSTPQGVVAVVEAVTVELVDLPAGANLVVVLAGVRDPGNAGTLVRSAAGAGADAVVFVAGSVDPFNPKTVRAAAGHLWQTAIVRDAPIAEVGEGLRGRGFKLFGTDAVAPLAHHDADLTGPVAVVIGNEAWGLPPEARSLVDELVAIRMPGPVESLNAAMAGSILLFEVVRQRSAA